MKAIILAGGKGTRLRPITANIPKPCVPIINTPILVHTINLLKQHGFEEIIITVGYLAREIEEILGDGTEFGVKITYYKEEIPLGTAGALKELQHQLKETFVVISSDVLTDINLTDMLNFHKKNNSIATIALTTAEIPVAYGIIVTDTNGQITKFLEKPRWSQVFSDKINTGIYILEPKTIKYVPVLSKYDFSKQLFPKLLEDGKNLFGYQMKDSYWLDIGNPEKFIQANHDILTGRIKGIKIPGKEIREGVWIGENCEIHPEAQLWGPSVIGNNCKIEEGTVVDRLSVLGNNVYVGQRSHIKSSIILNNATIRDEVDFENNTVICQRADVGSRTRILANAVIGDDSQLGTDVFINRNILIWPDKIIEDGSIVNVNVKHGSYVKAALFGPHGITGTSNVEITPEIATKIGASIGTYLRSKNEGLVRVVIGRDPKLISRMLKRAMISGLMSVGIEVLNVEVLPLPLISYATRESGANAGIAIKVPYAEVDRINIKIFDEMGIHLSDSESKKIEEIFFKETINRVSPDKIKDIVTYTLLIKEQYYENIIKSLDINKIKEARPRVVLDCGEGSGSMIAPYILQKLGCDVITLNAQMGIATPVGAFAPKMENISILQRTVKAVDAIIGIYLNEDAGRALFVDEEGKILEGDVTVALLAKARLKEKKAGKIVVPVHTSISIENSIKQNNGEIIRVKTGGRPIIEEVHDQKAIFGGEESGGFIFPDIHYSRDGIYASVYMVECLVKENSKLSELAKQIPKFYMAETEVPCPVEARGKLMLSLIEEAYDFGNVNTLDGLKIFFKYGWVLIRPSSSKEVYRIFAEGRTEKEANEIARHWKDELLEMIHEIETGI